MGTPVLYRQDRLGHHGKLFIIYKFRTMVDQRDANGVLLPDVERLTPIGKFKTHNLGRAARIVECLKGGYEPGRSRPLLVEYRDLYASEQWRRDRCPRAWLVP